MELTYNDSPTEIPTIQEVTRLLMAERHLTLLGRRGSAHERLLGAIAAQLPGVRYCAVQARYEPSRPPMVGLSHDPGLPSYLLVFVPDSPDNRMIIAIVMLVLDLHPVDARALCTADTCPILMLDDEKTLVSDYYLILNTLQELARGRVMDASLN
jgi:hypothetical protein